MINRIGYACVNTKLQKQNIKMRTCRKSTLNERGIDYLTDLILTNLNTLQQILEWNLKHDITFFRMGSELFPWMCEYDIESLPRFEEVQYEAAFLGEYARENDIRLSFHPGPFNVLCSPKIEVVERTIQELNDHSKIFDLMGYEPSFFNKINIHVGGAYGDHEGALKAWLKNYDRLDANTKCRLTIENDDKAGMYSVKMLHFLHKECGVPIVFDYFHHRFHPDGLSEQEALELALSTWPKDVVPVVHYSESRREEKTAIITDILTNNHISMDNLVEWPTLNTAYNHYTKIKYQAHSDFIQGPINNYGNTFDVMIEAKAKEQALFGYLNEETRKSLINETPIFNG